MINERGVHGTPACCSRATAPSQVLDAVGGDATLALAYAGAADVRQACYLAAVMACVPSPQARYAFA